MNLEREYDHLGRLAKEYFPNGKSIEISYDEMNRVIEIQIDKNGSIYYEYDDSNLLQVSRISSNGQTLYSHSYSYDNMGVLFNEELITNLGQISYENDLNEKFIKIESPYSQEICIFNTKGFITKRILNNKTFEYHYDNLNQLNPNKSEDKTLGLEYDDNGNLIKKISTKRKRHLEFDQYGKLIKAITDQFKIDYFYDDTGRRVVKKVQKGEKQTIETYLYFGNNEIAIYGEDGKLKQLRIPGLSFNNDFILPIAIKTKDEIYATIHDYQGNLSKLINIKTQEVISIPYIDPFGQNLDKIATPTPWLFASKHYEAETRLVYFGSRYYDPELMQWISPDPLGSLQHSNHYLYCLNNPLFYFDPDGEFAIPLVSLAWGAGALISFPIWSSTAIFTAAGATVGWATYEIIQKVKDGKQKDGTPKLNTAQNAQFDGAVKELERKLGKKYQRVSDENYIKKYQDKTMDIMI